MNSSRSDRLFLGAVLGLARTLEIDAVVEGVESELQARELEELECVLAQGFLYAHPMAAEAVSVVIRDGERAALSA